MHRRSLSRDTHECDRTCCHRDTQPAVRTRADTAAHRDSVPMPRPDDVVCVQSGHLQAAQPRLTEAGNAPLQAMLPDHGDIQAHGSLRGHAYRASAHARGGAAAVVRLTTTLPSSEQLATCSARSSKDRSFTRLRCASYRLTCRAATTKTPVGRYRTSSPPSASHCVRLLHYSSQSFACKRSLHDLHIIWLLLKLLMHALSSWCACCLELAEGLQEF